MALHYIVDGYNVIRKTPFLDCEKLKDAREALLKFIDIHRPQGSHNNVITVVFDGKNGFFNFEYQCEAAVAFAKTESADDYITNLVEKSGNPRAIKVVSDDKELGHNCRSRGAQIISVKEFIALPKRKKILRKKLDDAHKLSYAQKRKINEELEKVWLRKND